MQPHTEIKAYCADLEGITKARAISLKNNEGATAISHDLLNRLRKVISLVGLGLLSSCASNYNALTIVDDSLSPIGSQNQLVLAPDRGEVGHHFYSPDGNGAIDAYKFSGSGSKDWVLKNWGMPDRTYSDEGVEYLIYEKRSKDAPNYRFQYLGGERTVKLGYKNERLMHISAFFKNCPRYMKGPVYVLPK